MPERLARLCFNFMEETKKKPNPYIIIIVILILAVFALLYNQWKHGLFGKKSIGETKLSNIKTEISKDDIQIGNAKAPIAIIEYYSYLCSFCKEFEDGTGQKLLSNYVTIGKVKLILRPFPPYETGEAVLCAKEQDKFLEYHNYLFANNDKVQKTDDLKTFAKNIGLNESSFNQCLDSRRYKTRAEDWHKQGLSDMEKAKIPEDQRGTPMFFIDGEPLIGNQPYEIFTGIIEKKLAD